MPTIQKVLITGITGGIGSAIARKFSSLGWEVFGLASRPSNVRQKLQNTGVKIFTANFDDIPNLETALKNTGLTNRLDLLVNCAGITEDGFFSQMKEASWTKVVDINLLGAIVTTQFALPLLMKSELGRVINISSVSGYFGRETQVNYAATKGGLIGLSQLIEHSFPEDQRTHAISVVPGMINTGIASNVKGVKMDRFINSLIDARLGTSEEVANLVLALASDDVQYVNAGLFRIDGGMLL